LEIVHVQGKMQPYLDLKEGALNPNLLTHINRAFHLELRTVFSKTKREAQARKSNFIRYAVNDEQRLIRLLVKPLLTQHNNSFYYMVIFEDLDIPSSYIFLPEKLDLDQEQHQYALRNVELEHELSATKEHLQTFTEELETSNEELQAINEELQSANEELKSSNEELETSNEELQSSNEELHTSNSELAISNESLIEKESELQRSQEQLTINWDRFRLALENSPVIIFYQDTELRYTWQYNNHPDFKIEDVLGKNDYEVLGDNYRAWIDMKVQVITTGQSVQKEMNFNDRYYDITIKPDREEDKIIGIKGVALDITKLKEAQHELKVAKEKAEAAARIKENFLATMSHELRTPLNAIVGLSGLLLKKTHLPEQRENLEALHYSSDNMMALVNDILDFSKIEAGKVMLDMVPFSLNQFLKGLQQSYEISAQENNNQLIIDQDPNVLDWVIGDQLKLRQVLNNLIGNALKFTKDGKIEVSAQLKSKERNQAYILFSVKDSGLGIPAEKLEEIFKNFTQVDSSTRRKFGGTGLGLSITKRLLELMDSNIEVESEEGKGSHFFFTIALETTLSPDTTQKPESLPTDKSRLPKICMLLVDDVAINRMVFKQHFQDWQDIIINEATNGEEAVQKATENDYDIILMDIRMPVMDGYEASRKIREEDGLNKTTPILAITADTSELVQEKAGSFTDVITKPYKPQILFRKILHYTNHLSKEEPKLMVAFSGAEAPFSDKKELKTFYEAVRKQFLELKKLYQKPVGQKDTKELGDIIHKMKTTFLMFGVDMLKEKLNQDLEILQSDEKSKIEEATLQTQELINQVIQQIEDRIAQIDKPT